jgi:hypothetical protein
MPSWTPGQAAGGFRDKRLVAPALTLFEQRQPRGTGWGRSLRKMTRVPCGQSDRSSSPVTSATSPPARTPVGVEAGIQTASGTRMMA